MDDDIIAQIDGLIAEEHELRARAVEELSPDDQERIDELEVRLDQCWDLLRQRRAREEFGQDPDDASARPTDTVEGYWQ